jgi:uncharacterized protein YjhX (UPF0386 family)
MHKINEIIIELYEEDSKYFIDCFFNMYYQMKKKKVVDEKCYGDPDTIYRMWETLNRYKYYVNRKGMNPTTAALKACKAFNIDVEDFHRVINSFKAFKSAKKTRFKKLL